MEMTVAHSVVLSTVILVYIDFSHSVRRNDILKIIHLDYLFKVTRSRDTL